MIRTVAVLLCLLGGAEAFSSSLANSRRARGVSTALDAKARNGLVYDDVEIGQGRRVNAGDTILCYYEGKYTTQSKGAAAFSPFGGAQSKSVTFDATEPGEPAEFLVGKGQLIPGMDIGICGDLSLEIPPMNIGGDRKLKIPSQLAYGEAGVGDGAIPPNQDLEFQISIVNAETRTGISTEFKIAGYAGAVGFAAIVLGLGWFVFQNIM